MDHWGVFVVLFFFFSKQKNLLFLFGNNFNVYKDARILRKKPNTHFTQIHLLLLFYSSAVFASFLSVPLSIHPSCVYTYMCMDMCVYIYI